MVSNLIFIKSKTRLRFYVHIELGYYATRIESLTSDVVISWLLIKSRLFITVRQFRVSKSSSNLSNLDKFIYRVQIPEKHNNSNIISSVHPTSRWTRVISSRFNREVVTARELCQVAWLRMHTAGKARTKARNDPLIT